MSGITQNTLARIDKWLSYGTSMQTAFPKLEQRYRMQICSEFYKRWVQNKDIDPRTVCRNIARRDYELFFNQAAQGNKEAQEYVLDVSIVKRDRVNYTEEEKLRMARKYGLTTKDLQEIEDDELFSDKREEEPDYFEYMEKKDEEDVIRNGYMKESKLTNNSGPTDDAE